MTQEHPFRGVAVVQPLFALECAQCSVSYGFGYRSCFLCPWMHLLPLSLPASVICTPLSFTLDRFIGRCRCSGTWKLYLVISSYPGSPCIGCALAIAFRLHCFSNAIFSLSFGASCHRPLPCMSYTWIHSSGVGVSSCIVGSTATCAAVARHSWRLPRPSPSVPASPWRV